MGGTLNIDIATYQIPFEGETLSGDLCFTQYNERSDVLFVATIDVAGHGQAAFELAEVIRSFFQSINLFDGLENLVQLLHEHIRGTRGCAGSFCYLELASGSVQYVGVGNIRARIVGTRDRHFVNKDGIIGYRMPRLNLQTVRINHGDLLILYTDGIKEFFEVNELAINEQIATVNTSKIARHIIEAFGKTTDDSTCLVVRMK